MDRRKSRDDDDRKVLDDARDRKENDLAIVAVKKVRDSWEAGKAVVRGARVARPPGLLQPSQTQNLSKVVEKSARKSCESDLRRKYGIWILNMSEKLVERRQQMPLSFGRSISSMKTN